MADFQYGVTMAGRRRHIVRHRGLLVSECSRLLRGFVEPGGLPLCKVCIRALDYSSLEEGEVPIMPR